MTACNLEVIDAEVSNKSESADLDKLTSENRAIKLAYRNLQGKSKEINKKTLAFELKSILDGGDITKTEFKGTLKELEKI